MKGEKNTMDKTFQPPEPQNPWKNRGALPSIPPIRRILAALVITLSAAALPLCTSESVSIAVLALLFAYTVWVGRAPGPITLILLTAVAATFFFGSFSVGVVLLALIVGSATLAWLLTSLDSPIRYLALLLPLVGGAVSLPFVTDWRMACLSVVFLPAGLFLAVATLRGARRTSAICAVSGGLLLVVAAALFLHLWQTCGSLNREAIVAYIGGLRNGLAEELFSLRDQLLEIAKQDGTEQGAALYQSISETMTDESLTSLVQAFFNLIPAFAVILCNIIAFEAQYFLNLTYQTSGWRAVLTRESCLFSMSFSAAILYTVSFVMTIFVPDGSLLFAVVQNLSLILLPGFCVIGLGALLPMISGARGGLRVALILGLGALFCCSTMTALYILAIWGAYLTLTLPLRLKMMQKMMEEEARRKADAPNDENDREDRDDDQDGSR